MRKVNELKINDRILLNCPLAGERDHNRGWRNEFHDRFIK